MSTKPAVLLLVALVAGLTPAPVADGSSHLAPTLLVGGLVQPVFVTHAGDGSDRLFIVERHGHIRIHENGALLPEAFMNIDPRVGSGGQEQGLLGLAFEPDYETSGRFYVYYTNNAGASTLSRFAVKATDPNVADIGSEEVLLTVNQPFSNHNGGMLAFGPDGMLHVALGDGGLAADPAVNGQNLASLLGKILRLDVSGATGYDIPDDNPFAGLAGVRPEIWAYGLRNPWRFSFDTATGDLYIADVGQFEIEEVDFEPAGDAGGRNYGWNLFEGHGIHSTGVRVPTDLPGFAWPVHEYTHAEGCSVTGGYVYRGSAAPGLAGTYVFGDFCSGTIWGLQPGTWTRTTLASTGFFISSFGEDEAGGLYVVDLNGAVYTLA